MVEDLLEPPEENRPEGLGVGRFAAGQVGAAASGANARAGDALREGLELMLHRLGENRAPIAQRQGNLFEYIEAAKFNAAFARQNAGVNAVVTAAEGRPTVKADIELRRAGETTREVQAKSSDNPVWVAHKLSKDPAYGRMQKVTNPENVDDVRRVAKKAASREGNIYREGYEDTTKNVVSELQDGDVHSGGTSHGEATRAAKHTKRYVAEQDLRALGKEAAVSAGSAALTAGVIAGSLSLIQNAIEVSRGQATSREAAAGVGKDVSKAAVKGTAVGTLSAGLRYGASTLHAPLLAKGSVAGAVAAGLIDVGVNIHGYATGEISADVLTQRLADIGVSSCSGLYFGAAASAMIPGAIAPVVVSIGAYMVASHVYQACRELERRAQLAEEQARLVLRLSEEACREMDVQRASLEALLQSRLQAKIEALQPCFMRIDRGLEADDHYETISGLADLAGLFGERLRLMSGPEFDRFMEDEGGTLHI